MRRQTYEPRFEVGQRVRFIDPLKQSGGRTTTGTVLRSGDFVDVRWDDGKVSLMVATAALEVSTDTKDGNNANEETPEKNGPSDTD